MELLKITYLSISMIHQDALYLYHDTLSPTIDKVDFSITPSRQYYVSLRDVS